jgi:phosphatidylglycerophosphatase A
MNGVLFALRYLAQGKRSYPYKRTPESLMASTSISVIVAQLGGLGKAPVAPGTVATVVAGIPTVFLLSLVGRPLALLLLLLLLVAGCVSADEAERKLGRTDPGEVVIDELVGFVITMFGFPFTPPAVLMGVLSFRVLDIWKPWPIRLLQERLKGGVGIVVDDVAAGFLAHGIVWIGLRLCG